MITLEGKPVTEKIIERITEKQAKLTKQPCLAVLGIEGDDASNKRPCSNPAFKFLFLV